MSRMGISAWQPRLRGCRTRTTGLRSAASTVAVAGAKRRFHSL